MQDVPQSFVVERLADYPWSSCGACAYGQNPADWLTTGLILEQFKVSKPHKVDREKLQGYGRGENGYGRIYVTGSIWESLQSHLFCGKPHRHGDQKEAANR